MSEEQKEIKSDDVEKALSGEKLEDTSENTNALLLRAEYFVDDLNIFAKDKESGKNVLNKDLRVIFLLESPHKNEIKHKHPLAGSTGLKFYTYLAAVGLLGQCCPAMPLGCYLKSTQNTDIGIMNCSRLPLQKSAYSCEIDVPADFERIRKRLALLEKNIDKVLVNDLKRRLEKVGGEKVLLLPLGGCAMNFLMHISLSPDNLKKFRKFKKKTNAFTEVDHKQYSCLKTKLPGSLKALTTLSDENAHPSASGWDGLTCSTLIRIQSALAGQKKDLPILAGSCRPDEKCKNSKKACSHRDKIGECPANGCGHHPPDKRKKKSG